MQTKRVSSVLVAPRFEDRPNVRDIDIHPLQEAE